MKKLLFFLLCLGYTFASLAQNNLVFVEANQAYNGGDYSKAIGLYEKVLKTGEHSANLYFNLANSYYKTQKTAASIYNYEKALALSPENEAIQINYGYAKQNRLDTIETLPKGFLSRFYTKLLQMPVDFWAWLAIGAVFVFVIGFVLFYKSEYALQRKLYFGVWSLSLLLAVFSLLLSYASFNYKQETTYGIVFSTEVSIQSEPNLRSEQVFKLHEGTKVQVLEKLDNWHKILLSDGRLGWMPDKEIKIL